MKKNILKATLVAALVITIAELQLVADAKYLLVDNRKHFMSFLTNLSIIH